MPKIELIFDVTDIEEGEKFFLSKLHDMVQEVKPKQQFRRADLVTSKTSMDSPNLIIDLVNEVLPIFATIILLWLGKGKKIKIKVNGKYIKLSNIKETSASEIIKIIMKNMDTKKDENRTPL